MIKLDTFSRAKLLDKAKKLQIPGITDNITKTALIAKLQPVVDDNSNVMNDMLVDGVTATNATTKVSTTADERQWAAYLKKFNMTPAQFLKRFPNHPFKIVIAKLQK